MEGVENRIGSPFPPAQNLGFLGWTEVTSMRKGTASTKQVENEEGCRPLVRTETVVVAGHRHSSGGVGSRE